MKNLNIFLFGLDRQLYNILSPSAQKAYTIKVLALLVSLTMSVVVSVEITHAVTGELVLKTVVPVTVIWLFFILVMDLTLLRQGGPATWFRLLFSLALVSVTATSAFMFVARPDIINELEAEAEDRVAVIESVYNNEKLNRYKALKAKEDHQLDYYQNIVAPEAMNVYAGDKYNLKNAHNLVLLEEIKIEKKKLDEQENEFYNKYLKKVEEAQAISVPGLFDLVRKTFDYIFSDSIKIGLFIVLSIVLICIESYVFFISLGSKSEEYNFLKKKKEEYLITRNEKILNNWHHEQDHEIDNKNKVSEVKSKLNLVKYLQNIREGYKQAKSVEPELFSPETDTNINAILSTEIVDAQKNFERKMNEVLGVFSTTIDDDENNIQDDDTLLFSDDEIIDNQLDISTYKVNTFYCTMSMKDLADRLWLEANNNNYIYAQKLFDWSVENIQYQNSHDLEHYKTAREVFNSRSGICGEMAILINALLKYKGLKPNYIHVDIDEHGKPVNHACTGIKFDETYVLIDVAYKSFDVRHQKWNKVSDNHLIKNMTRWNK